MLFWYPMFLLFLISIVKLVLDVILAYRDPGWSRRYYKEKQ